MPLLFSNPEVTRSPRKIGIIVWIIVHYLRIFIVELLRFPFKTLSLLLTFHIIAARHGLIMIELNLVGPDIVAMQLVMYSDAQINIVIGHGEIFIKTMNRCKIFCRNHAAGGSDGVIIHIFDQSPKITQIGAGETDLNVSSCTAESKNNAGMLNRFRRIVQLRANYAHTVELRKRDHPRDPRRTDDFCIVIQKQQVFAFCFLCGKVINPREIKRDIDRKSVV